MPDIRFGVSYSRLHSVVPIPQFGEAVESIGFDGVWVTEGLVNELPALDILMSLQAFVSCTQRITVGTGVLLLPLRNPAIVAKQVATADVISDGRVILGVGVGGSRNSNPAGFEVCGIPLKERGGRTDEALEVMTKLWTGEPVSHSGRYHSFENITMYPPPRQRPHPPIWTGGGSAERVLRRTARWCDGFLPTEIASEHYPGLWDRIRRYGDEYGRDTSGMVKALHIYLSLDTDRDAARAVAERTLTERYGFDVTLPDEPGKYAFGTVDDCARVIEAFVAVGVTDFVFNTVRPLSEVLGQVERLGTEVMPHFT